MLLGKSIFDIEGKEYSMAGILPFKAKKGNLKIGYREAISKNKSPITDIQNKLIGYTLLRKRSYRIGNKNTEKKYLLFDTLIIDKPYRKKKYSSLLMKFNNKVIKKRGFFSFLICEKKLVLFYKKNNWKKLNKKSINLIDHTFSSYGMIYNNKKKYKEYFFNINK